MTLLSSETIPSPQQWLGPLMIGLDGPKLSEEERALLLHPMVGGVILFARNYVDHAQLRRLTADIRALRTPALLIAVDHEGGRVQRFRDGFTRLPAMGEIAASCASAPGAALSAAREQGLTIARELTADGIDLAFAPVLDIDHGVSEVIGDRALGGDADTVVALASAFCDGLSEAGMAATGKHYPGHGAVAVDSHAVLPVDGRDLATLRRECLRPFARMSARGIASMMTAHVRYPAVDALPATFSERWLQDILRGELGFEGVIISDDLDMGGAQVIGDAAARAIAAQQAGCELLLLCNDRASVLQVLDAPLTAPDARSSARLETLRHRRMGNAD